MIAGPVPQGLACPKLFFPGLAGALRAGLSGTPSHLGVNFGSPSAGLRVSAG